MMENKKIESNEDVKTFMFSHKIHRIICYFSLISIPCLFVPLVYSFNVFGLIGVILISILTIFLCYWCNTYKLILYNDKFVLQNIRKRTFMLSQIQSISLNQQDYLKITYNDKVYLSSGFLPFIWCGSADHDKNFELLKILEKAIKKAKTGKVNRKASKDIEVIAEKRMWTLFVILFYLLFDVILIFSLINEWNIVVFWITLILSIIVVFLLTHKIISPKIIILYDPNNKTLVIHKIFKTIEINISDIIYVFSNSRAHFLEIRLKNKRNILVPGIKKLDNTYKRLNELIK